MTNPRAIAIIGIVSMKRIRSFVAWYLRLLWTMTKKAPAFWLGCFFGALIAQAPDIASAAIRLALVRIG